MCDFVCVCVWLYRYRASLAVFKCFTFIPLTQPWSAVARETAFGVPSWDVYCTCEYVYVRCHVCRYVWVHVSQLGQRMFCIWSVGGSYFPLLLSLGNLCSTFWLLLRPIHTLLTNILSCTQDIDPHVLKEVVTHIVTLELHLSNFSSPLNQEEWFTDNKTTIKILQFTALLKYTMVPKLLKKFSIVSHQYLYYSVYQKNALCARHSVTVQQHLITRYVRRKYCSQLNLTHTHTHTSSQAYAH